MRNPDYLKFIRRQPCCLCGAVEGIHAHHVDTGGMGIKGSDYSVVPLCFTHHNFIHTKNGKKHPLFKAVIKRLRAQYKEKNNGL